MKTRRCPAIAPNRAAFRVFRAIALPAACLCLAASLAFAQAPRKAPRSEERALKGLPAEYRKERDAGKRVALLNRIGALRTREARAFLEGVVEKSDDSTLRTAALRAWARSGLPAEEEFLQRLASTDKDANMRREAVSNLRYRKGMRSGPFLARRVKIEKDARVKRAILASASTYPARYSLPILEEALGGEDQGLAGYALSLLGNVRDKRAYRLLRANLGKGTDSERASAFRAYARSKSPDIAELGVRLLGELKQDLARSQIIDALSTAARGLEATRAVFTLTIPDGQTRTRASVPRFLERVRDSESLDYLAKNIAANPRADCRRSVYRALAFSKTDAARKALADALKREPDGAAFTAVVEASLKRKIPGVRDEVMRRSNSNDPRKSAPAIAFLARPGLRTPETEALLARLAARRDQRWLAPRLVALETLGRIDSDTAFRTLKKSTGDPLWQVRVAAYAGLREQRRKETVDLLVQRLGRERGRPVLDAWNALKRLVGLDFGLDAGVWKKWWSAARKSFRFPDPEKAGAPAPAPRGGGARRSVEMKGPSFYSVPVLSERVVFVVDISGSMSAKMADPLPEITGRRPQAALPADPTRLDVAKRELVGVISGFKSCVRFNVIFFESSVHAWKDHLVSASAANRANAVANAMRQRPTGGTNLFDAIDKAFEDSQVDTLYVLSDGAPGAGRITGTAEILAEVRRMNITRRIAIHAISIGSDSKFLASLAEENQGNYVYRR